MIGPGARILHQARREGVVAFLRERFNYRVRNPLRWKVLYPLQIKRHRRQLRRRVRSWSSPESRITPGRVFVISCIDTEGPSTRDVNSDWERVAREVGRVNDPSFRAALADSDGRPLVVSWFIMDWVGAERSYRGRDIGFHRILDRYLPCIAEVRNAGYDDGIYWHYHHLARENTETSNRDWLSNQTYEEILSRWVLDRGLWPVVYRAGNTWEDAASSRWLDRWFPFDLSNRAPYRGWNYDWSRAPTSWKLYHPHSDDPAEQGTLHRLMGRCLSLENGAFSADEVERAFQRAAEGKDSYLAAFTHDYKTMHTYLQSGIETIRRVSQRYPAVSWMHANALTCFRELAERPGPGRLELDVQLEGRRVLVAASHELFGPQPWLAARFGTTYRRIDMVAEGGRWACELPEVPDALAAAAADRNGNSSVRPAAGLGAFTTNLCERETATRETLQRG